MGGSKKRKKKRREGDGMLSSAIPFPFLRHRSSPYETLHTRANTLSPIHYTPQHIALNSKSTLKPTHIPLVLQLYDLSAPALIDLLRRRRDRLRWCRLEEFSERVDSVQDFLRGRISLNERRRGDKVGRERERVLGSIDRERQGSERLQGRDERESEVSVG